MNTRTTKQAGNEAQQSGGILVLYENPASREEAISFCEEFTKQSGATGEVGVRCFPFAAMNVPAKSTEALQQAVLADLIIFAVTPTGDLPDQLKFWTVSWLVKRGERECALVGLVAG